MSLALNRIVIQHPRTPLNRISAEENYQRSSVVCSSTSVYVLCVSLVPYLFRTLLTCYESRHVFLSVLHYQVFISLSTFFEIYQNCRNSITVRFDLITGLHQRAIILSLVKHAACKLSYWIRLFKANWKSAEVFFSTFVPSRSTAPSPRKSLSCWKLCKFFCVYFIKIC